jgi:hypothetical protein
MTTINNEKCPKSQPIFCCELCDYSTSRNDHYKRHITTPKHIKTTTLTTNDNENEGKSHQKKYSCEICEKKYNDRAGLWRHKKKCLETKQEEVSDKDLIMMLVKQNTELLEIVKNGTHHTNNNTTHTNSHNKTFNLQFFLNETCKDAMNITDFVETIKVQISDLIKIGEIGYVEGISNIITTSLNALDVTQRPIHCTDKKREVLYVKDEDKWEKENEDKDKVRKAIKTVSSKNIQNLPKFVKEYPDCKNSDSPFSDQYSQILIESMGNDCENEDKIIKNIYGQVVIDKDAMTV